MDTIIKTLTAADSSLSVTAAGRRSELASFTGRIEITEHTSYVPLLGALHKGMKSIHASFITCGNIDYKMPVNENTIHAGRVFDAKATVSGERLRFSGLKFIDSDPIENELVFELTDYELIEKLLKM